MNAPLELPLAHATYRGPPLPPGPLGRAQPASLPAGEVPPTPPVPGGQGGTEPAAALADIAAERRRQIKDFGHTPEADLRLQPGVLPGRANRMAVMVMDDLTFRRGDFHARARKHAVQLGALALATIDWIDGQPAGPAS